MQDKDGFATFVETLIKWSPIIILLSLQEALDRIKMIEVSLKKAQ
jgi:hypothetical protein